MTPHQRARALARWARGESLEAEREAFSAVQASAGSAVIGAPIKVAGTRNGPRTVAVGGRFDRRFGA